MQVFCFSWAINKTVDSIWIVLSAFGWFVKFSNRRQTMRFVLSMCTHFFCSFKRIVQLKSISYHDVHPSPVSSLKMDNLWTTYPMTYMRNENPEMVTFSIFGVLQRSEKSFKYWISDQRSNRSYSFGFHSMYRLILLSLILVACFSWIKLWWNYNIFSNCGDMYPPWPWIKFVQNVKFMCL